MGTEKHSVASKNRWKKVPKKKRIELMSKLKTAAWAKMTPAQRKAQAKKAAATRKANKAKLLNQK